MTQVLIAKENLKNFIGKYEVYLKPLGKFLLALITLLMINGTVGYMERIQGFSIVLVAALMCSFMPANFIIVVAALFLVLNFYALSMECAFVAIIVFLFMALVYFRFSPKDTLVVLILPICFVLKIPYVVPIGMGLIGTPVSAVSVACGVVVYYLSHYISENASALSALSTEDMSVRFRYVVDGMLNNRTMMVMVITSVITVFVVYTIRRLSINHSWSVAIVTGAVAQMVILLMADLLLDTDISIVGILAGSIVSAGMAKVIEFFAFNVDYSRTENVQFEDDEYYYYVKAVPKITVAKPEKMVKKINSQNKRKKVQR